VVHAIKPAYEIRVYASTGASLVTFFEDAESAARYADEQRTRFA
jgi:hypothetical protein